MTLLHYPMSFVWAVLWFECGIVPHRLRYRILGPKMACFGSLRKPQGIRALAGGHESLEAGLLGYRHFPFQPVLLFPNLPQCEQGTP